jgi:hypothetical protein
MKVYIDGIGLCGPGLANWQAGKAILSGTAPYVFAPTVIPVPSLLPATERRRTVPTVKLALAIGEEALAAAGLAPAETATVFASSGGDGETVHAILEVLAAPNREVSPTKFHNSVHNAPSGYWAIAAQSHAPTTSICGYDDSFAVGLVDVAAQAVTEARPVALIAYDLPYPEPLHSLRPIYSSFGTALVLSPARGNSSLAALDIEIAPAGPAPTRAHNALEILRTGNPAARSLPLLAALACGGKQTMTLDYLAYNTLSLGLEYFAYADA